MRKPRDIDAELKVLGERARQLQQRKVEQLGALYPSGGCRLAGRVSDRS